MLNSSSSRLASFALTLGIGVTGVLAPVAAPVAQARSSDPVQLRLRQVNGRVDVVIAGLGPDGRVTSQRHAGSSWAARLKSASLSDVQLGSKELRVPSQGLVSIRLEHSNEGLALSVEAQPEMSDGPVGSATARAGRSINSCPSNEGACVGSSGW